MNTEITPEENEQEEDENQTSFDDGGTNPPDPKKPQTLEED